MIQPEYRIYLIGTRVIAFAVITSSLDYRIKQDVVLKLVPPSWYISISYYIIMMTDDSFVNMIK
jgi:hypothetical protein